MIEERRLSRRRSRNANYIIQKDPRRASGLAIGSPGKGHFRAGWKTRANQSASGTSAVVLGTSLWHFLILSASEGTSCQARDGILEAPWAYENRSEEGTRAGEVSPP